jgi:hypothetical protein
MLVGSGSIVKERSRRWNGGAAKFGIAAALCLIGLAGCSSLNPIDALTGGSKDDPAKDEANTANLEAGSQEPSPSVGSVPGTPTRGLTEAQREKLAEGLVSDRNNAHYIDDDGGKGTASAVMSAPALQDQLPVAIPSAPPADAAPAAPAAPATAPAAPAAAAPAAPAPRPAAGSGNFVTGGFLGHSGSGQPVNP